jgi:hypothetical protein
MKIAAVLGISAALATATAAAAPGPAKLPANALRGPAHELEQYPTVSLASAAQRTAAEDLYDRMVAAVMEWRNPRRAAAAGFRTRRARRVPGSRSILWFHAEHRRYHHDRVYLDPERPDTLIYADLPGRPLVLVGVMFSMRRGMRGPSPGGPITRWHWHLVCADGRGRGLRPRRGGSCPRGSRLRAGSEMLHVWFTRDLRSAYAIHAPVPELCGARLLPAGRCRQIRH